MRVTRSSAVRELRSFAENSEDSLFLYGASNEAIFKAVKAAFPDADSFLNSERGVVPFVVVTSDMIFRPDLTDYMPKTWIGSIYNALCHERKFRFKLDGDICRLFKDERRIFVNGDEEWKHLSLVPYLEIRWHGQSEFAYELATEQVTSINMSTFLPNN